MKLLQDGDIFAIAVVLIAGHIGRCRALHLADGVCGAVPDGLAFAIFIPCALHLECSSRHSPQEAVGKLRVRNFILSNRAGHLLWRLACRCRKSVGQRQAGDSGALEGIGEKLATVHALEPPRRAR